jgi:hypothetical protein
MATFASNPRRADCPECYSRNVIVLTVTTTVVSLYCLGCEHLFAAEVFPSREDACLGQPLATQAPSPRVVSIFRSMPRP